MTFLLITTPGPPLYGLVQKADATRALSSRPRRLAHTHPALAFKLQASSFSIGNTMACPECVTGTLHSGTPVGAETKVGGIDAYVVGDASSPRIIVLGVDVFGWRFANTRLLADEYAARGFRVVVPDLFGGWSVPTWSLDAHDPSNAHKSLLQRFILAPAALFLLVPFVLRNLPRQVRTITTVATALRAAAAAAPHTKLGFVGFCWGGRFAITLNALFDASVAAHPSLVRFPDELANVRRPFSLAVAADDANFDRARAEETERILRGSLPARGLGEGDVEVVVYEGVQHGWTTRANLTDERQRKARDDAVEQVVRWFEKYLTVAPSSEVVAGEAAPAPSAST
ncbi:Alpha/Beta hydrolase protein [Trametes gibbosa]|nr:Alpha/Beta hydrolase protein [Trametes gibbosa]